MFLKLNIYQRGMTMIELLVVIAIMSILLSISFWGYQQRGEELILRRTAYQVVSDIEDTREMAMSARKFNSGNRPEGGYGIYFNSSFPNQYIIFADNNQNKQYDVSERVGDIISLDSKITISDLKVNSSLSSPINIVFQPPSPDVYINSPTKNLNIAEITLTLKSDHSKQKKIFINSSGLVWLAN